MKGRHTRDIVVFVVGVLVLSCGLAHADVLSEYFGVTLELDAGNSYTDAYQNLTSYPIDPDSFTPTRDIPRKNWITGDWYGDWSNVDFDYTTRAGQYPSGAEPYDVEAIYFDNDATNMYISIVTSFEPSPGYTETRLDPEALIVTGDLAIDLHGKGVNAAPHIDGGFRYDYGVNINYEVRPESEDDDATSGGTTIGNEVYETYNSDWYLGTPTAAVKAGGELTNFDPNYTGFSGALKGEATVTYSSYDFGVDDETLFSTYVINATIPRNLLPALEVDDFIGIGWVEGCRDDGNAVDACLRLEGQTVPEPSSMALVSLVIGALGWLRRRKSTD